MTVKSMAGAKGVADLAENASRVNGRWRPLKAVSFGTFRIESRGGMWEVMEGTAHRTRKHDLASAILFVATLDPELDLLSYKSEAA